MNTCNTCKWWGAAKSGPHSYGQHKVCEHIVRNLGVDYSASVSPIHDNDFLSDLFTGPQFGCIHHEAKL